MKTSTLLVATLLGFAIATTQGQTQSSTTTSYVQTSKIVTSEGYFVDRRIPALLSTPAQNETIVRALGRQAVARPKDRESIFARTRLPIGKFRSCLYPA